MSKRAAMSLLAGVSGMLMREKAYVPVVPSHKIERKEKVEQLSERRLQRMKGKKARKNRGRNRPQDTALYASLRR